MRGGGGDGKDGKKRSGQGKIKLWIDSKRAKRKGGKRELKKGKRVWTGWGDRKLVDSKKDKKKKVFFLHAWFIFWNGKRTFKRTSLLAPDNWEKRK